MSDNPDTKIVKEGWFRRNLYAIQHILAFVSAALISLCIHITQYIGIWSWVLTITSVILFIAVAWTNNRNKNTLLKVINALKEANGTLKNTCETVSEKYESLNFKYTILVNSSKDLLDYMLLNIANGPIACNNSSDRITLYLHFNENEKEKFLLLSRFSSNPNFRTHHGRTYSTMEGCINKSWEEGCFEIACLPDPKKEMKEYKAASKKYGVPPNRVNKLTMKSRYYFGYRIKDVQQKTDMAVIIIESVEPKRFEKEFLKMHFETTYCQMISQMLSLYKEHLPIPPEAKERGL